MWTVGNIEHHEQKRYLGSAHTLHLRLNLETLTTTTVLRVQSISSQPSFCFPIDHLHEDQLHHVKHRQYNAKTASSASLVPDTQSMMMTYRRIACSLAN